MFICICYFWFDSQRAGAICFKKSLKSPQNLIPLVQIIWTYFSSNQEFPEPTKMKLSHSDINSVAPYTVALNLSTANHGWTHSHFSSHQSEITEMQTT